MIFCEIDHLQCFYSGNCLDLSSPWNFTISLRQNEKRYNNMKHFIWSFTTTKCHRNFAKIANKIETFMYQTFLEINIWMVWQICVLQKSKIRQLTFPRLSQIVPVLRNAKTHKQEMIRSIKLRANLGKQASNIHF